MQVKSILLLISAGLFLTSCTSIMNPYSSNFSCPKYYKGKCVSLTEAYKESIRNTDGMPAKDNASKQIRQLAINTVQNEGKRSSISLYQRDMLRKMSGLIKQPKTPIVIPPKTMRVLILPYVNSQNELEMGRYVYFFVGKPRWLFSPMD